jgi:hypothetical protein
MTLGTQKVHKKAQRMNLDELHNRRAGKTRAINPPSRYRGRILNLTRGD